MKKNIYDVRTVGLAFLWAILLPIVLVLGIELVLAFFVNGDQTAFETLLENKFINILITMSAQIAFLIIIYCYNKNINIKTASKLNTNFGTKNIIICFIIGILGNFLLTPLSSCASSLLDFFGYDLSSELPFEMNTIATLILGIFLFAFVPAIVEELLFRGIILQGLRKFGNTTAILLSSFLFVLVHFSAEQFVFPFLFGIVMAYMVVKTGSILASMIIHFTSNTFSILCFYFNFELAFDIETWLFVVLSILCVVALYAIVYFLAKYVKNTDIKDIEKLDEAINEVETTEVAKVEQLEKVNNSTTILKTAIVVAVVMWIINFAYCII